MTIEGATMARIVLDQVTKTYRGGVNGVDGLSLDIADGEFMVLVGPSGCGKSTAPRSIAGPGGPAVTARSPSRAGAGHGGWGGTRHRPAPAPAATRTPPSR